MGSTPESSGSDLISSSAASRFNSESVPYTVYTGGMPVTIWPPGDSTTGLAVPFSPGVDARTVIITESIPWYQNVVKLEVTYCI